MEKDRKFRALAIAAICVAIVGVSVAYAALTASLTITGTATVSTENAWKIEWTNVTDLTKSSAVTGSKPVITAGNQEITWSATFGAPQTKLSFTATFKNNGTIPAKLNAGTYLNATGDAASKFTYTITEAGADIADRAGYVLEAGAEVDLLITVEFDKNAALSSTELANLNTKTATFTLELPWSQATDAEVSAAGSKKWTA